MHTFIMNADDETLLLKDHNIASLHAIAVKELKKVHIWISSNNLRLNISETSHILYQNRSIKKSIPPIIVNSESVKQVNHTKFLGINVDENLNWKFHIEYVCSKVSKVIGVLYRVKHNLTTAAITAINQHIYMSINYGIPYDVATY